MRIVQRSGPPLDVVKGESKDRTRVAPEQWSDKFAETLDSNLFIVVGVE
jgi:hypothetical protein